MSGGIEGSPAVALCLNVPGHDSWTTKSLIRQTVVAGDQTRDSLVFCEWFIVTWWFGKQLSTVTIYNQSSDADQIVLLY